MREEIVRKLMTDGIGLNDPEIEEYTELLNECWARLAKYNGTPMYTPDELNRGISEVLGYQVDDSTKVLPPFRCDLGFNIRLGKNVIVNYNCTFLDSGPITVGDHTMIGPDCHIITANHSLEPDKRLDWKTYCKPITIGRNCWLGANVTIVPGVTVGDNATVGAGSVVTKDVPEGAVVVGNPAKRVRRALRD